MFTKQKHRNLKPCKVVLFRLNQETKEKTGKIDEQVGPVSQDERSQDLSSFEDTVPQIKEEIKQESNEGFNEECLANVKEENEDAYVKEENEDAYEEKWSVECGNVQESREISIPNIKKEVKKEYMGEHDYINGTEKSENPLEDDDDVIVDCVINFPKWRCSRKNKLTWDGSSHEVVASCSSNSVMSAGDYGDDDDDDDDGDGDDYIIPEGYIKKESTEDDLNVEDEITISEEYLHQLNNGFEENDCASDPLSIENVDFAVKHQNSLQAIDGAKISSGVMQMEPPRLENDGSGKYLFFCTFCPVWTTDEYLMKMHNLKHVPENSASKASSPLPSLAPLSSATTDTRNSSKNELFSCTLCNVQFSDKFRMQIHVQGHTSDKPFACLDCPARFYKKEMLKEHVRNHVLGFTYACSSCPSRFSHKSNLDSHSLTHKVRSCPPLVIRKIPLKRKVTNPCKATSIKIKMTTCSLCGARVPCKRKRGRPRKGGRCAKCPQSYPEKHEARKKGRPPRKSVDKLFPCLSCEATFTQESDLVAHMQQQHSNETQKLFQCSICPAKFVVESHLARHSVSHSGEKPFSCSMCPAKFTLESYLTTHLLSHSGEKPFMCPKCPAKFALKLNLKKHMNIHAVVSQKPNLKARILSHMV